MTPTPTPAGALAANLTAMLSMLLWAAGLPAADPLIAALPPLPLAAARMGLAALILLPLWLMLEGPPVLRAARWPLGIGIGGATLGLGAFCLVVGQGLTDPVTVAVISAAMPVIGLAIEVIADARRLTPALILGFALSLLGGLWALDLAGADLGFGWGALLCLVSVVTFTLGSRWTVTCFPGLTPLGRTTITLTGAAIATLAAALAHWAIGGAPGDWGGLGPEGWARLALFAVGGLAFSQVLWIAAVGRLGIALSALHINAAPFYVMLILLALGGTWNWAQATGAALVGAGVLVAQNLVPLPPARRA